MRLVNLQKLSVVASVALICSLLYPNTATAGLYAFSSHTFTTCSATGNTGPAQAACRSAYSTTWDENDANFTVVNGIQKWTVPSSGTYRIKAIGSVGGGVSGNFGYGASIQGDFTLAQGEVLLILVGQQGISGGGSYAQGGGGGSFVTKSDNTILVIGGGGGSMASGGGDAGSATTARACGDASITNSGRAACAYSGTPSDGYGAAGTNGGAGGAISSAWNGYPGSGFLANASVGGAKSWANGMLGGNLSTYGVGGFGGGGSGGMYGGSGGGGYSGGGANARHAHGGGGGSYNSGANKVETLNNAVAVGSVVITLVALALSDSTITLSIPSNATFRSATSIIATASTVGKVTYFANGKRIPGCINISTVSSGTITATCNWKPSSRGSVQISAQLSPTDAAAFRSSQSNSGIVTVLRRTGPR